MERPQMPRHRLREARIRRGWSQQEVADRIGTTHINVSRWERGLTLPRPYFRRLLCTLFEVNERALGLAEDSLLPDTSREPDVAVYDPALPLPPAGPLIGRDGIMRSLKAQLSGGDGTVVALFGLPGVGKTALALALAHDADLRTPFEGVLWAALGPDPNMQEVFSRWGKLFGIPSSQMNRQGDLADLSMALRNAIGNRALLVVIDDAWRAEDVIWLQVGGPASAHLMTTRFPAIATQIASHAATVIQELSEEESMRLLRQLAPDAVRCDAGRAADLVRAVGGLPLALVLMGSYLRKHAHSGQHRRLTAALSRLTDAALRLHISEPSSPIERHPSLSEASSISLYATFAGTISHLGAPARLALQRLSEFPPKPASFSEEAALVRASCSVDDLDTLSDMGLLESSGQGRYTLHPVVADCARLDAERATCLGKAAELCNN